jgi:predicted MPP superfamily phosphohydrolase
MKDYFNNKKKIIVLVILLAIPILFVASIFYLRSETYSLQIEEVTINTGFKSRFVLISDLHLGVNKKADYLQKIVDDINIVENVVFVAITGDFLYVNSVETPTFSNFEELFAPLKQISKPIYAVLGNHDYTLKKYQLLDRLKATLSNSNVQLIEDNIINLNGYFITGVKDYWFFPNATLSVEAQKNVANTIVLTHNPDVVMNFKQDVGLTVAGHTHCSQIRITGIYGLMEPNMSEYNDGPIRLFVSCGTGESGIPLRLWVKPTINIINTE